MPLSRRLPAAALPLVALLAALIASGCNLVAPAAEPQAFTLEYATGSIPPPYNYTYTLDARDEGGTLRVRYTLTYRYRGTMTPAQLRAQGYSPEDDLTWEGAVAGAERTAWLELAKRTSLRPPDDRQASGGDHIGVLVRTADGGQRAGEPADRDEWQRLADELDQRARRELRHPRATR